MAANLELIINAKDQASGALGAISKKAGALSNTLGTALKAGALAGGGALIGLGGVLLKTGIDFDAAFDKIKIGTGATGKALEGLNDDFKKVFSTVPTTMDAAATAIADLNTRTGASGPALQKMAAQILELTRMTEGDLSLNIEQITRVMGDWGISVEQSGKAIDDLFKTSQATGPSVENLSRLMVQFGAPMRQLGFDFNTAAALLGKFEKEGVNTELVMGSMRIALGKMARDGEPAIETFKRITMQIKEAGDTSEANSIALELFGARAGPDMAAAIREGRFEVDELLKSINDLDGGVLETSEETQDFSERLTVLKNRIQVAAEPIATAMIVNLTKFADLLLQEVFPVLEAFVGYLKAVVEDGDELNDWLTHIPTPLQGVALAMAEVVKWIKDELVPWINEKLIPALTSLADFLRDHIIPRFYDGMLVIQDFYNLALKPLGDYILNNKYALIAAITAIGVAVVIWFGPGAVVVTALLGVITLLGVMRHHWEDLNNFMKEHRLAITAVSVALMVLMWPLTLIAGTVAILAANWDWATKAVKELVGWIEKLIDVLGKIPTGGFGFLGGIFGMGVLPGLRHEGGYVRASSPYIVGEGGPELFVPSASGMIVPNDRMGGNISLTVNFHSTVSTASPAEMERAAITLKSLLRNAI